MSKNFDATMMLSEIMRKNMFLDYIKYEEKRMEKLFKKLLNKQNQRRHETAKIDTLER